MLARLGRAVYWLCCVFAASIVAFGIASWHDRFSTASNGRSVMLVFAAAAAIVWTRARLPLRLVRRLN
jgi:hypothetical protein